MSRYDARAEGQDKVERCCFGSVRAHFKRSVFKQEYQVTASAIQLCLQLAWDMQRTALTAYCSSSLGQGLISEQVLGAL